MNILNCYGEFNINLRANCHIVFSHKSMSDNQNSKSAIHVDSTRFEERLDRIEGNVNEVNFRHQIILEAAQNRNEQL